MDRTFIVRGIKGMDICFVILHYMAYEMTKECIDTLLGVFEGKKFHIAVIDNGSANETGEKLKEQYSDNKNVTVLMNKENLGFAKGNNVGYKYVKERFKPKYIVVMNNDVLIKDRYFIEKIQKIDETFEFAVLGPDILNPYYKCHQNPLRKKPITVQEVKRRIVKFTLKIKYAHVCSVLSFIRNTVFGVPHISRTVEEYGVPQCDVVLNGACLILSDRFIEKREECFNPQTFLYGEEHIFYHECVSKKLKMVYSPEVSVEHYERVSTDASFKSNYEKYITKNLWRKESAMIMLRALEQRRFEKNDIRCYTDL